MVLHLPKMQWYRLDVNGSREDYHRQLSILGSTCVNLPDANGKVDYIPWDPWDWYIYLHLFDFDGKCR